VNEIYRTSLHTERRREEFRFILTRTNLLMERRRVEDDAAAAVLIFRLSLPLALWPQFHETVYCLGSFMIPLPAPAYLAKSCCSYSCSLPPGPVTLELGRQEQLNLSLQNCRGSTFLEIKAVNSAAAVNSNKTQAICIGPTLWSAFLTTIQTLAQLIADF
jgi:hypothetical protein